MADDLYQMLFGGSADAEQASKAMSDLLRYKKGMALVGSMAGGPMGNAAMMEKQGAEEQKNQLTGLDKRMQYGQEAQNFKDTLAHQKQLADYQTKAMMANAGLQRADIMGQYALQRTIEAQKGKEAQASDKLDKLAQAEYNKLSKEWDPSQQVRSAFGQAGQTDYNAIRGLATAIRSTKPGEKIDPNILQQAELAGSLGRIVTGGVPTASTMEHFNPGSVQKLAAHWQSLLSGKPVTTGMTEWADQMIKMLEGESEASRSFIRHNRLQNTERLRRYAEMKPESARRFLSSHGMDKPHPEGYIDPETFDVQGFNPGMSAAEMARSGSGLANTAAAPAGKVKRYNPATDSFE